MKTQPFQGVGPGVPHGRWARAAICKGHPPHKPSDVIRATLTSGCASSAVLCSPCIRPGGSSVWRRAACFPRRCAARPQFPGLPTLRRSRQSFPVTRASLGHFAGAVARSLRVGIARRPCTRPERPRRMQAVIEHASQVQSSWRNRAISPRSLATARRSPELGVVPAWPRGASRCSGGNVAVHALCLSSMSAADR